MDLGEKISAFSLTMHLPLYSGDAAATGGPGRQGNGGGGSWGRTFSTRPMHVSGMAG